MSDTFLFWLYIHFCMIYYTLRILMNNNNKKHTITLLQCMNKWKCIFSKGVRSHVTMHWSELSRKWKWKIRMGTSYAMNLLAFIQTVKLNKFVIVSWTQKKHIDEDQKQNKWKTNIIWTYPKIWAFSMFVTIDHQYRCIIFGIHFQAYDWFWFQSPLNYQWHRNMDDQPRRQLIYSPNL